MGDEYHVKHNLKITNTNYRGNMNSKERVLRIIDPKEADRIPTELRIMPEMRNKLLKYFNLMNGKKS